MTSSLLTEISCPNCLSPINLEGHTDTITCDACSSNFVLEGHLCSNCFKYYKNEVDVCGRCGTSMTRQCRKCHTRNWAGDEYCKSCGVAMDLLDMAAIRHTDLSAQHRDRRSQEIREMRTKSEESSRRRLAEMQARERQRLAEIERRMQAQRKRDRVTVSLIGFGVFIILAAVSIFAFL